MKKTIGTLSFLFAAMQLLAQEPADALRYSWYNPGGTARTQAIGGAMGSLGGDITATFVNPAGLAFYRTGDVVLTPQFQFGRTKGSYLGKDSRETNQRFNFGTSGVVWGTDMSRRGKKKSAAISLAYNRTADFNANFTYAGVNNQSSYSQKFLEQIGSIRDGNVVSNDFPTGTSLAFNTFWIDTVGGGSNGNFQFQSRALPLLATGLIQQQTVTTRGGIHDFALGLAANLEEKWLFGGSLSIPVVDYRRDAVFAEGDATENGNNRFEDAVLSETFRTTGYGLNLKAGVIYKPQEFWRIGLAIHSPTFYRLTDRYDYTVTTNTEGYKGKQTQSTGDVTGTDLSEYKYWLFSPYRVIGSVSYVLRETEDVTRQRGFITADVEYVRHTASSFSTDDEVNNGPEDKAYFKALNGVVDKAYKGAFNFRVGGELKFTTLMVRLGGAYYGNPYQDLSGEFGDRLNLSGGLGYRNKGFFVDLTYVHSRNRDVHYAYRLENGFFSGARINSNVGQVLATVGWKL